MTGQGYRHTGGGIEREEIVEIPGGGIRRPDITMIDPQGRIYRENIGDVTLGGNPIARERRALEDLIRATRGGTVRFTPKREY